LAAIPTGGRGQGMKYNRLPIITNLSISAEITDRSIGDHIGVWHGD
jgi:hypothetical protein